MIKIYVRENAVIFKLGSKRKRHVAKSFGFFILCYSNTKEYELKHQIQHIRDWWKNPLVYSFKYRFDWTYRLWAECRAYETEENRDIAIIKIRSRYCAPHSATVSNNTLNRMICTYLDYPIFKCVFF